MNKFKKWLIENYGVETWDKFKKNVKDDGEFKTLESLFNKSKECDYVGAGFWWSDTVDEFDFWNNINGAWQKHLESKK